VLGFFSSRLNWDYPTPSPTGECVPPSQAGECVPLWLGWGTHSLAEEGVGVPIPTRGQTQWYSRYIYVLCGQQQSGAGVSEYLLSSTCIVKKSSWKYECQKIEIAAGILISSHKDFSFGMCFYIWFFISSLCSYK
jgi:hypothetical protein